MNDFIYIEENSLSHELCNEIIGLYEKSKIKFHGNTHSGVDKNVKNTTDINIFDILNEDIDLFKDMCSDEKFIWKEISNCLKKELSNNIKLYFDRINSNDDYNLNSDIKYLVLEGCCDELYYDSFLIQRYIKGHGKYVYHDDSSIEPESNKYRILTYIWYLNDVELGGETEFYGGEIKINPQVGKLLLFPATWTFPHKGCVPFSDNKYIITGWVYSKIIFKEWH